MRTTRIITALVLAGLTVSGVRAATTHHHAHAHGKAALELTIKEGAIQGVFRTPMDNLLGFEHAPKTENQKNSVELLRQRLSDASRFFAPNAAAQCLPTPSHFSSAMFSTGGQNGHSDLEYRFGFDCNRPRELKSIEALLLEHYPRMHEIRTELVSETGQRAVILKKDNRRLTIK